ncbi:MAG: metallophosphoesterase [Oscillospiraceae bacterium]|nr:metallophosphoesterase [Oscillospiraceae bacterium]
MIYFTGDMHGARERFSDRALSKLKKTDFLLICGDFGFVWDGSKEERAFLKKIGRKKYTVAFVDGAHENFNLLNEYSVEDFCGGKARHISGNLWHLCRGEIYEIDGKKVFAMGGGENTDFDSQGIASQWSGAEIPSREDLRQGANKLKRAGMEVDYIITHEPPLKLKEFLTLRQKTETSVTVLNAFLEELSRNVKYKRWFFGSLHMDKHISASQTAVFSGVLAGE